MVDLKVGDRVYYSIHYESGEYFSEAPNTSQRITVIETIEPFDDCYIITLESIDYTMVLSLADGGKIMKGEALSNDAEKPEKKSDVAKAFITQNYLNYSRETVLYYKRLLERTPQYEKDWNGNMIPSWAYASTMASYKKFLRRLEGTGYEEMYPEDFI